MKVVLTFFIDLRIMLRFLHYVNAANRTIILLKKRSKR